MVFLIPPSHNVRNICCPFTSLFNMFLDINCFILYWEKGVIYLRLQSIIGKINSNKSRLKSLNFIAADSKLNNDRN